MVAELTRDEKTGDLVATTLLGEVRLRAPAPGGDWWTIMLAGERFLSIPATEAHEAQARARLLVRVLDTSSSIAQSESSLGLELKRRHYLELRRQLAALVGLPEGASGDNEVTDEQLLEAVAGLVSEPHEPEVPPGAPEAANDEPALDEPIPFTVTPAGKDVAALVAKLAAHRGAETVAKVTRLEVVVKFDGGRR